MSWHSFQLVTEIFEPMTYFMWVPVYVGHQTDWIVDGWSDFCSNWCGFSPWWLWCNDVTDQDRRDDVITQTDELTWWHHWADRHKCVVTHCVHANADVMSKAYRIPLHSRTQWRAWLGAFRLAASGSSVHMLKPNSVGNRTLSRSAVGSRTNFESWRQIGELSGILLKF